MDRRPRCRNNSDHLLYPAHYCQERGRKIHFRHDCNRCVTILLCAHVAGAHPSGKRHDHGRVGHRPNECELSAHGNRRTANLPAEVRTIVSRELCHLNRVIECLFGGRLHQLVPG